MRYFRLWPRGNDRDKTLAFVRDEPAGLGLYDYYMRQGERIGEHYPANAKVYLDPQTPGIKLESVLGNLCSYLMVSTAMRDLVLGVCTNEIEVLPFTLYNHKKRVHSTDYVILNPIGTYDCVNRKASTITYEGDAIVGVAKLVFDSNKVEGAPHLFRVPEKPSWYFISETLARAIKNSNLTNVILKEEILLQPGD